MTTHSWGENPIGKWILEIHNDAYSNWGSEAKFFRWSLKLYGTQSDPNSERQEDHAWYEDTDDTAEKRRSDYNLRNKVVRESPQVPTTTETSTTTTTMTTTRVIPTESKMQGCISTTINCTRNRADCRIFTHRKVASVFCKCTPKLCLGVASQGTQFNLQCSMRTVNRKKTSKSSKSSKSLSSSPKLPFYCQFIPFFSYTQKR